MVHFNQTLMSDVPLATSLPTTYTFHPNNQIDDHPSLQQQQQQQQQSLPTTSQNSSTSSQQPMSNGEQNSNHQSGSNDYETRLRYINSLDLNINFDLILFRCPNCETWVVNLSDHLRKTHRIASPVDRKPLLRMARLEKRRMAESAGNSTSPNSTLLKTSSASAMVVNGLPTSHTNTNEIENLLFKQEHDTNTLGNQQFSLTLPENILLNQQMTNSIVHYGSSMKRQHDLDDNLDHLTNDPLSPNKKSRLGLVDGTKLNNTSPNKSSKKNRNKQQQQQQQQQAQTIIKTAASGIFPQQGQPPTVTMQNIEESSDDVR